MRLSAILFLLPLVSCVHNYTKQELQGIYIPIGNKNNSDSIQLLNNGTFKRKIYDKNKKLVLEAEGTWQMNANKIKFKKFYLNLDQDFAEGNTKLDDGYYDIETVLETSNNTIQFCVGYYERENCYLKIK